MHKIAVLGIGNILIGDDGLGSEVVKRLEQLGWPANVSFIDGGTAVMSLLHVFIENDTIIVVDCLKGGYEPGTIYRLTPEQLGAWHKESLSLHDVQVLDVLQMAALFDSRPEIIIYGMEPLNLDTTLHLSARIEERLPVLIEHVRQELARLVSNTNLEKTIKS